MERYIGLDAHQDSCTLAVVSERGKRLKSAVVETNGKALVEFVKTVAGRTHLCLEEGTQSSWLYEVLSPHVDEAVVAHLAEHGRGPKDDLRDAFCLADRLRLGSVTPVFKDAGKLGQLRAQADVYTKLVSDVARVKTRLKALYRSRGVSTSGRWVYSEAHRAEYLTQLPRAYRGAARCLYEQLDALLEIKDDAEQDLLEMSSKHAISSVLRTCPGMGPIRVAQVIPIIVSPHRFRTARQLWSYSGLGIVMRSSSDWVRSAGGWQRDDVRKTRGLNRNFNRRLKMIFKGAATTVISARLEPMYGDYLRTTEQGTKPPLAKLTLSRRIASAMLAMWKNQEAYDPQRNARTS